MNIQISEEDIFSFTEESSTVLSNDWTFITESPNEIETSTTIDLTISYKGRYIQTTMEPSIVTGEYSITELNRVFCKAIGDHTNSPFCFTFAGQKLRNDTELKNALEISFEPNSLSLCANLKFVKHSCVMCLSTTCKHVEKINNERKNENKRKNRKRRVNQQDHFNHLFLNEETQLCNSKKLTKKRRTDKVTSEESDDHLSFSDNSEDNITFSIIDPLGIHQFN